MSKQNKKLQKGELSRVLKRALSYVTRFYKKEIIIVIISIIISGIIMSVNTLFIQTLIDDFITPLLKSDVTEEFKNAKLQELNILLIIMAALYLVGALFSYIYYRLMAIISEGVMKEIRDEMFAHMEKLPLSYFDSRTHGVIMSFYTNDTESLRVLLQMTIPQVIQSTVQITCSLAAMLYLNRILSLVVVGLTSFIWIFTTIIVRKSSKYFQANQENLSLLEGHAEEYINGQKVIKVFNHEEKSKEKFAKIAENTCACATKANQYANILMPTANNLGNLDYIIVMIIGGCIAITNPQLISIGAIVSFINFTKAFTNPVGLMANQLTYVITAAAGASRVFKFLDEEVELDDGYVTLVNSTKDQDGNIIETKERTGHWAWRHYHKADNTVSYVPWEGDIVFENVDFSYVKGKQILKDISLYARPGQKVAFVGATGAGKTTITNLINRFYDIDSGKIRYDGINIEKIKKDDLRNSLGMVLQDTNLFTGTIKDNIKYGKPDATDEEIIAAAKLANADSFIRMLPNGYDTMLYAGGASLSQGQRQLISIARAAIVDPPVMILDEATSSIDTRTEALVQKGMDALMEGRTVFVIAHRLSTVRNSDVIMVLDHGKIIERGTHEQLIEQKGTYYQLYTGAFELE